MIQIKRVYEPAGDDDGLRVLVDRLWPRGVSKERAKIDRWAKELSPSPELRKWFAHDPANWAEFQRRYRKELREHEDELRQIAATSRQRRMTLIYGAKDEEHYEAVVLRDTIRELGDE